MNAREAAIAQILKGVEALQKEGQRERMAAVLTTPIDPDQSVHAALANAALSAAHSIRNTISLLETDDQAALKK